MPPKSDQIRMRHMADAAQKALTFTKGKTRADLDKDDQMALATVRLIDHRGGCCQDHPGDQRGTSRGSLE